MVIMEVSGHHLDPAVFALTVSSTSQKCFGFGLAGKLMAHRRYSAVPNENATR